MWSDVVSFTSAANLMALTFEREQADIARIVFAGVVGRSAITQVAYGLPEPSSLVLCARGMAATGLHKMRGVGGGGRREKRRCATSSAGQCTARRLRG